MDADYLLKVTNVSCVRQFNPIFSNLNFCVSPGQLLLIEGANGSGKSSLLRLITGIATPSSGHVTWKEAPNFHFISHTNGVKLGLTVQENLLLVSQLTKTRINNIEIESVLSLLKLDKQIDTQVKYLSAGQKRRVALAKLWLFPKLLWILDEPLTALDVSTQTLFTNFLDEHLTAGGAAIISTHHQITSQRATVKHIRLGV